MTDNTPNPIDRLDNGFKTGPLKPFADSSSGDVGPVEDDGYVSPLADGPDNDLLDEEDRDSYMTMPEGID